MSPLIWLLLPAVTAALLAAVLTPLVARLAVAVGALDMPGDRKIHTGPIPRLGGLAVVTSIAVVLAGAPLLSGGRWELPSHLATGLAFGVLPVFLISLLDDVRSARARYKVIAHTLGAAIAVSFGISLDPVVHLFGTPIYIGLLAAPLSVLWIVGVTNAFNIIDGLDGLAAGLALISAAGMAAVFVIVGQGGMAGVALVLVGALAGFLPYNVHPARLFLGDTGATAIGFCLAVFALKGGSTLSSGFAALLPVFILGLPIADTLISIARRTVGRLENTSGGMFVADRNHIHHRLLSLGIDHGRAVLFLYGGGVLLAGAAFLSVFLKAREAGLFVVALVLAAFVGVHRLGYDEFAVLRRGTVLKVYEMPAVKRGMFVVFVDIVLAILTAYLAVGLKSDEWRVLLVRQSVIELATTFAPVTVLLFWWCGMYRGSWRVAGIQDLTRACTAVAIVTVLGTTLVQLFSGGGYPASLFVIYGLIALMLTTGLRASYVILESTKLRKGHMGMPVLVYGAGGRGVAAVRELFQNSTAGLRPIGFIDDDARMRGKLVSGLPVFGTGRELEVIIEAEGARALVIASEKISPDRLERAAQACKAAAVSVFRLDVTVERLSDGGRPVEIVEKLIPAPMQREAVPPIPLATLHLLGCEPCPSCSSREVFRSKARSLYEKLRKAHTPKRIFRCHDCGWRGWAFPLTYATAPLEETTTVFDLTSLDGALPQGLPSAPAASRGDRF
jgi:UDP-GlcNAc:undecaprenyl-phosphate GlcNAc-1-phosphate transferase